MRDIPVILFTGQHRYPERIPFHPPTRFPELDFLGDETDPENGVYAGVRNLLRAAGYDRAHYGGPQWSPLSDLCATGGTIVIKPNFVRHFSENPRGSLESVVTHVSILRPLIDFALKATGPKGRVIVADAAQYDCEIETLLERNHLPELLDFYRAQKGMNVEWRDLRVEFGRHDRGIQTEKRALAGDPEGYEAVNLGSSSEFSDLDPSRSQLLRGADYDETVTIRHHADGKNEYLVSKTILNADLVINVPKVKTHKKSGVTLSMKNLIGINGDKNWLPHYRAGFVERGGDEFPRPDVYARFRHAGAEMARGLLKRGIGSGLLRRLRAVEDVSGLGRRARNGNWHGNDTIWRTCIDLNKIFYHGDRRGTLGTPTRRVLNVYDGIIAGEGDGPMGPDSRPIGLLASGEDGGCVDVVIAWMMGFDWRKIPVLREATREPRDGFRITRFEGRPEDLEVCWIDDQGERRCAFADIDLNLGFAPHPGWRGHIERPEEEEEASACAN